MAELRNIHFSVNNYLENSIKKFTGTKKVNLNIKTILFKSVKY